ncbi:Ku protein [Cereibacter sp. SYSU M97828]|nr:Ku protein [Cereibacter flavus]
MARSAYWKGYLKLSLVTCPVAMVPATTEAEKVRFHILNRATGNRVIARYLDSGTGKPVAEDDEVKGFPRGEDDHVILEDEELEAVALESTRTIDIDMFVPADSIGWIWLDTPYYLSPNGKVGEEAFAVIREAMVATKTVGISRLVIARRERAVMLEPRENGIILWTLHYGDEVREPQGADEEKAPTRQLTMVKKLIDARKRDWDPAMVKDPVQETLLKMVAARKRKKKPAAKKKEESNVVDIMDALKRSLAKK